MAKGFKHGSGGQMLNFKVVGGTAAPENPKENTVWINSDAEITSWIFSATEPESPAEGMVWFTTGTYSPADFNALKKNGIQVYPMSAKQYVSGAWVDVTAKTYQGNAWVDWFTYLFKDGDTFDDITGGWERKTYQTDSKGSVTISDCLILNSAGLNFTVCAGLINFDPTSLSKFTELIAEVEFTVSGNGPGVRIGIVPDYSLGDTGIDSKWTAATLVQTGGAFTMTLDVSEISTGYPMVSCFNGVFTVKEIYLK